MVVVVVVVCECVTCVCVCVCVCVARHILRLSNVSVLIAEDTSVVLRVLLNLMKL